MADNRLTDEEFVTLSSFEHPDATAEVDPAHFAKLLSLALIEQKEGGAELTTPGRERLAMGLHPRP